MSLNQAVVGPEFNLNIKLTPRQKKEIIALRKQGVCVAEIAERYNISKSYVYILTKPGLLEKVNEANKRNHKNWYNKEKQRRYVKNYRHHKRELINQGLIDNG